MRMTSFWNTFSFCLGKRLSQRGVPQCQAAPQNHAGSTVAARPIPRARPTGTVGLCQRYVWGEAPQNCTAAPAKGGGAGSSEGLRQSPPMLSSVGAPQPSRDQQGKAPGAAHPTPLGNNKGLECSSPHTGGFLSITGLIMGRAVIRAGSAPCGHSSSVPLGRDSFHSAF